MSYKYKLRKEIRYVEHVGLAEVYCLDGMPFLYDELDELHNYDAGLIERASVHPLVSIEELTRNSEYLIMEECHPLIYEIPCDEQSIYPPL
jgi:hypothetical protein